MPIALVVRRSSSTRRMNRKSSYLGRIQVPPMIKTVVPLALVKRVAVPGYCHCQYFHCPGAITFFNTRTRVPRPGYPGTKHQRHHNASVARTHQANSTKNNATQCQHCSGAYMKSNDFGTASHEFQYHFGLSAASFTYC
eukprot:596028-Rhodomonas_salina.1